MKNIIGCVLRYGRSELLLFLVSYGLFESVSMRNFAPKPYINMEFWLMFIEFIISAFENRWSNLF